MPSATVWERTESHATPPAVTRPATTSTLTSARRWSRRTTYPATASSVPDMRT